MFGGSYGVLGRAYGVLGWVGGSPGVFGGDCGVLGAVIWSWRGSWGLWGIGGGYGFFVGSWGVFEGGRKEAWGGPGVWEGWMVYQYKGMGLSVGTIICGWDKRGPGGFGGVFGGVVGFFEGLMGSLGGVMGSLGGVMGS